MDLYFRLMGCVTWTIAIVAFVMQVFKTVDAVKYETRKEICLHVLYSIAIALLGSGLGMLFFQYGRSIA